MADVSRLLEVGSGEYIQWISKSVSSCWEGRGGTLQHTHMFLKCSNVLLFYCRCITEMKFNNLLYTVPIKRGFFALTLTSKVQTRSSSERRLRASVHTFPVCSRDSASLEFPGKRWAGRGRGKKKTSPQALCETLEKAFLAESEKTRST